MCLCAHAHVCVRVLGTRVVGLGRCQSVSPSGLQRCSSGHTSESRERGGGEAHIQIRSKRKRGREQTFCTEARKYACRSITRRSRPPLRTSFPTFFPLLISTPNAGGTKHRTTRSDLRRNKRGPPGFLMGGDIHLKPIKRDSAFDREPAEAEVYPS